MIKIFNIIMFLLIIIFMLSIFNYYSSDKTIGAKNYNRKNIETYSWSNSSQKIIETTYFSFIPVGGFEIEF